MKSGKVSMDEELKSLELDKPTNWNKSSEIIAKHSVESQFESKPIERSLHLLRKGDDVQKLSVIQALPQLLQYDANATLTRIVPKIQQELPKSSCEFHIATSKIFKLLIEKQLPLNLVTAVLQGIDSKDPDVSIAWVETLVSVIPILPIDQIKSHVLPAALSKTQTSNPIFSRVNCCRILGKCASHPKMGNIDVKTTILPAVQNFCQDVSPEVRATMCSQLHFVAEGLGQNLVQSGLLPNLVELASDENMIVRSSAVSAAVLMIPFLNKDTKSETIVPLIKQLCQKTKDIGDTTFPMIAKQFGKLVDALGDDLSQADSVWFLQFFKTLATKGAHLSNIKDNQEAAQAVMCREQCAFNLPAVTVFTVKRASNQMELWHDIFSKLANDPCYLVRKTTASSVHEVAKILATNCKLMKDDLIKLLRDDSEDILFMLVPNIGVTLELFCVNGVLSREQTNQSTLEISRALLKCHVELSKGHNWRIKTELLAQLERLPNCVPSDFIHQHFTPVMLNCLIQSRAKPLRSQAGRTLLVFLRYNLKEMQRKWIRDNLVQNLCYAKNCYTRQIYVSVCQHAISLFSTVYFKKHFFETLIALADDPVSNIRWSVIALLPQLCRMLIMPEDKKLQVSIDNIFLKMDLEEKDKDVKGAFRERLKEIRSPFDNKSSQAMDDKRKLEEENKIFQGKPIGVPAAAGGGGGGGGTLRVTVGSTPTVTGPSSAASNATVGSGGAAGAAGAERISREQVNRSPSQRSTSAPPRTTKSAGSTGSSDMSFLEQHFYIDAGISLPPYNDLDCNIYNNASSAAAAAAVAQDFQRNLTLSVENINIEGMSESDLKKLEISTTNITDDVKVNLRKRNNNNNKSLKTTTISNRYSLIKPKRYSSIYSTSCLENGDGKKQSAVIVNNRRSLNIAAGGVVTVVGGGDLSKIPVCLKKSNSVDVVSTAVAAKSSKSSSENENPLRNHKSYNNRLRCRPKSEILLHKESKVLLEKQSNNDGGAKVINSIKLNNVPIIINKKSIKETSCSSSNSKPSALPVLKRTASEMSRKQ